MMNISKNTALERLEEFTYEFPDNDAVIFEPDERMTFRELWDPRMLLCTACRAV